MLNLSQAEFQPHQMVLPLIRVHDGQMGKVKSRLKTSGARYFFKEWRKHRGFTQEELAGTIGITPSAISQIETGKQGFTDSTLEAFAAALACSPGDLLMRNPLDEDAPWSIWDTIPKPDRPRALLLLKAFAKTGTRN